MSRAPYLLLIPCTHCMSHILTHMISPPLLAPHQMPYRRSSGCCVPADAHSAAASVRKISIAILITHILAMILFCFTAFIIWAPWAAVITAIAYLTGIVSSAIVISTPTQSSYRLGSVLYAAVGVHDVLILVPWIFMAGTVSSDYWFMMFLLALPTILGAISSWTGWMFIRTAYTGEPFLNGDLENPPILAGRLSSDAQPMNFSQRL